MSKGLGPKRMKELREKMAHRRALTESVETIAPYTDADMEFEPLDPDTQERVAEASRKDA